MSAYKVAIIGSGNIGTDLLVKIMRSPVLECSLFVGRNFESPGMQKARALGAPVSDKGIQALIDQKDDYELVFDCTNAAAHQEHWIVLEKMGKRVIDMTPSKIGEMIVPAVNIADCFTSQNVNMVSCGGQASIPIAYAIGKAHSEVEYVEVVSSISSRSAGLGTRLNLDEYVETTEEALRIFSGAKKAKTILILNPADPAVIMQTTISVKVKEPNMPELEKEFQHMVQTMKKYVPGYNVIIEPTWETNRILVSVRVEGLGDYLPKHAGNLDIINCAAIETAETYARTSLEQSKPVDIQRVRPRSPQ